MRKLASMLVRLCTVTALAATGLVTMTQPAQATLLDVTCTPPSSETTAYSPPLTATVVPIAIQATTIYSPCVSATVPGLTSGVRTTNITRPSSCTSLLAAGTTTFTITWNTGQTSTITANTTATVAGAALIVTFTGTVVSGLFAGDSVLQTVTTPAVSYLLCTLGLGTVPSAYGEVVLSITSVS
ncbi:hypothetical protein F4553_000061 [Allocatelliglobosispora scoriae]|uniref:Ig-like domain-containing protein n=1 Tax=Allocatelliglobosispora scoriae TaxID=643052 RepID=A0A841BIT0_9ACTN|nr:hypothetical protein [Allocatelliglobosispora scoriae]MBB5866682.1 hypothetical protein [Allocatelliglobosispora scoriae]